MPYTELKVFLKSHRKNIAQQETIELVNEFIESGTVKSATDARIIAHEAMVLLFDDVNNLGGNLWISTHYDPAVEDDGTRRVFVVEYKAQLERLSELAGVSNQVAVVLAITANPHMYPGNIGWNAIHTFTAWQRNMKGFFSTRAPLSCSIFQQAINLTNVLEPLK